MKSPAPITAAVAFLRSIVSLLLSARPRTGAACIPTLRISGTIIVATTKHSAITKNASA